ncbi:MAG: hypothetical protein ACYC2H_03065 [Thermoplasmatota archaeon]
MGFLQHWLDEPDSSIARLAKLFYAATFLFMAVFAVQLVFLALRRGDPAVVGDVIGPLVSLFLTATMYGLALDGRRSYKTMKAPVGVGADGPG